MHIKNGLFNRNAKPRTRPGKVYPGGRSMRRALKNLSAAQRAFMPNMPNAKQTKCTYPGSNNI